MTTVTTPSTSAPDTLARQHAIEHALSAALFHLRQPYSLASLHAATGRARRALSLLKQACTDAKQDGAA